MRIYEGDFNGQGRRVAIVIARFNEAIGRRLLDGALKMACADTASPMRLSRSPGCPVPSRSRWWPGGSPRAGDTTR